MMYNHVIDQYVETLYSCKYISYWTFYHRYCIFEKKILISNPEIGDNNILIFIFKNTLQIALIIFNTYEKLNSIYAHKNLKRSSVFILLLPPRKQC